MPPARRYFSPPVPRLMNPVTLARTLIETPSPTGEEAAVGRLVAGMLRNLDLRVDQQQVAPERFNLIAASSAPPRVVFSTHMDTVPPVLPFREDEHALYGRGACDAKGIIAVQVAAAHRLLEAGENRIGLLFTVDEEMGGLGAQKANEHPLAAQCRFLINGEPTDNRLATGTKGSLRVRVRAEGREAHSAYPEEGTSAIEKLLDALADVRAARWPEDETLGETTVNIGVIGGGTRPNVVPGAAHADLQIRLVTPPEVVLQQLERVLAGRATTEVLSVSSPLHLHTVEGFETQSVRFTTDIPYLSNWGTPLLLGPGSILVAHTDDERVAKADLHEAVDLYVRLAQQLLAGL